MGIADMGIADIDIADMDIADIFVITIALKIVHILYKKKINFF